MPHRLLNNPIADYLGGATFIASISLKSMEWFNLANMNFDWFLTPLLIEYLSHFLCTK